MDSPSGFKTTCFWKLEPVTLQYILNTGSNFQKHVVLISLKIDFVLTNSADQDEMHSIFVFTVCQSIRLEVSGT